VFCSIFITIFLFSFFFFYIFNRHLCHGAYWCTHNLAHLFMFRFLLYFHFCNSCVCVCQLLYTLPSSSILIHIYRHICMYIRFDYYVMTLYILYTPIIIRLYVPAPRGWARCWHNWDFMFKGLRFNIHPCLCFLWIHTYHIQIKNVQFCVHLALPYVRSSTMSLFVSIPLTWKRADVKMFTPRLFGTH